MIDFINIKIATPKIIDEYYRDKKKYCKSYRFYRPKCLKGNCNDCDHCIAVAYITGDILTNDATLFLRKHKKIKNDDLNIIDYVTSIIQHEAIHIALLNIGEFIMTSHKYDNIAESIEERKGFPIGFFSNEFDSNEYRRNKHL
jgi:hypothetical protein